MKKCITILTLIGTFVFLANPVSASKISTADETSATVKLTPKNYDEVVAKKGVVFVDFWAVWCGPCRRMNPILEELAKEKKDKVIIGKLDVDQYSDFATEKRVFSLPTILIYKDGKEITRATGVVSKEKLAEVIDYLASVEEPQN